MQYRIQNQRLDEAILEAMGDDPAKSKYAELEIHPTFLKRWQYWIQKDISDTERDEY